MRSLHWRIVASLVGLTALVIAIWIGFLNRGPTDPAARVRRLLARPNPHRYVNQAAIVIRNAEQRDPNAAPPIYRALLCDSDERVRQGGLMLLSDRGAGRITDSHPVEGGDEIRALLLVWFAGASLEERRARLPYSFLCWCYAHAATASPTDTDEPPRRAMAVASLPAEELRWLLAVTLERSEPARTLVDDLLLAPPPADQAARRLRYLDGMDGATRIRAALERGELRPINAADLVGALPPQLALLDRLADPNPAVRQAAGRLLAVCGDARGLPGLHEWLRAHLRFSTPANTLMTTLFGDDWRTRDASSRPARDARPRGG